MQLIRLILVPHLEPDGAHHERFDAHLNGQRIVTSRSPLYDGARALLRLGVHRDTLLTIRHSTNTSDSFEPAPIGELARYTIAERDKDGLRRERWRPGPSTRDTRRSA